MMRFADLAGLARAAEQWLLPGECLSCHGPVGAADPLICPPCQSRWRALPFPQCARCGQPVSTVASGCRICAAWPDELGRVRSAVWFDDGARPVVHQLKYAGWWRVAEPMARLMARLEPCRESGVLVPVPLGAARARRRGYNQAERLGRVLADRSGHPLRAELLRRTRDTRTQTALAPEQRRANVAGAFEAGPVPRGARVVLIDDVFTTGATLVEAARILAEAGAGVVEAVTFARALPPVW
jgi:ComF family protein